MNDDYDAIVIGAGPNGLVAANLLADEGWSVLLVEEQHTVGGAVRSSELLEPGFVNDWFSAFYPLAAWSPAISSLNLHEHGLKWCRSETPLAHPRRDGSVALVASDIDRTAAVLDTFAAGDGDRWRSIHADWLKIAPDVLGTLFDLFPPLRRLLSVARSAGPRGLAELLMLTASGSQGSGNRWFAGDGGRRLLTGNALHADLSPRLPPSAVYGWVLMNLAQQVGYPAPEGGAGKLTEAMRSRFEAAGGHVVTGVRVTGVRTEAGRAAGVDFAEGGASAGRAVIADVGAPQLYMQLLPHAVVPHRVKRAIDRFTYDHATVKIDWTLEHPIPWQSSEVSDAGTVHIAEGPAAMARYARATAKGMLAKDAYLVIGQYDALDPTRAPAGKSTAWAYTHVPQNLRSDERGEISGDWNERDRELIAERIENEIEALAPGFRGSVRLRHVMVPPDFEAKDRNLVNGAVNGGTSRLRQQLFLRPVPGLARPETPVKRLLLASASTHPGGGVHGANGAAAARVAIANDRGETDISRFARRIQG